MDLENLRKAIVPLYLEDYPSHVELIGTGICVNYKGNYLILTASHVAKQFSEKSLVVPEFINDTSNFELVNIKGSSSYIKNEFLDIGYFKLEESLKGVPFLDFDNTVCSTGDFIKFVLYGYPCSKNKQRGTVMEAKPYSISAIMADLSREQANLKRFEFPILFDKNKVWVDNKPVVAPDLNGMSGGPIFATKNNKDYFLFGLIEKYNDNQKILNNQKILVGIYAFVFKILFERNNL